MMRLLFTSFLSIFLCINALCQESDFQTWTCFSLTKKINKKNNIYIKQGLRFRENSSILSKSFVDIKLRFKYNKRWFYSFGYRDSKDWNKELQQESKNRYYLDVSYASKKLNRFNINVRNRYQYQGSSALAYNSSLRQKISLSYNIRRTKMDPEISVEHFLQENMIINKLRYTLGFSYPINKDLDLDLRYRIQQEINVANSETLFIFEGKLSYDL